MHTAHAQLIDHSLWFDWLQLYTVLSCLLLCVQGINSLGLPGNQAQLADSRKHVSANLPSLMNGLQLQEEPGVDGVCYVWKK